MAAKWTLCFVCVLLVAMVDSQTTQSLNGTQPSTSDQENDDGSVLDKSMTAFYKMVDGFLGVVQPNKIGEQSWLNISQLVKGDFASLDVTKWQNYTNYFVGFAVCFVVGILFCIIMPIVGCCFCCCRCCNRCGGRKKIHDPKRAKCKRISYCTVLLILTTIMLAGVVCAFVANDLIHQYLQNENNRGPVGKIDSALSSIVGYVNNTVDDVQSRALHAFDKTRNDLVAEINTTGSRAVDDVTEMINATSFIKKAEDLSKEVNDTQMDLKAVEFYLNALQSNGTELTNQLSAIRGRIQSFCTSPCNVDTTGYQTEANFTGLSDLSTEAGNVAKSLDMSQYISEAKQTINYAKSNATKQIQDQITDASSTLDNIRGSIDTQIQKFKKQINNVTKFASDGSRTIDEAITPEVKKYFDYVWYAGFGICAVYLLIVLCYYVGVLFGLCGERPGYDAPCCNKGAGANFLMAGVGFSFIFCWLLMLLTAIFFMIGGPVYTELCRYFDGHDPQQIKFVSDALDQQFDLGKLMYNDPNVHLDVVTVLENCKDNKPVYEALKLENLVNLSALIDLTEIDMKIDAIADQNFNLGDINIVSADLKQKIEDFGKAGLDSINFAEFDTQMQAKLTTANLTRLADELTTVANGQSDPIKTNLTTEANNLRTLQSTYVTNMERDVRRLNASLMSLKTHLDIQNRTKDLVNGLTEAQDTFNANSSTLVKKLVTDLARSLKDTARTNVNGLITDVTTNVGRCKPVFDAVYDLTDAVCKTILNPFNSLWFSWGWCLFFFIPSIIFAVKLAGLYRREDEYKEKDFDDANFSMYGGDIRNTDTIPLTSIENQRHGSSGYPGVANSGYHPNDNGRHSYSNGYQPYNGYPAHPTGDRLPPKY